VDPVGDIALPPHSSGDVHYCYCPRSGRAVVRLPFAVARAIITFFSRFPAKTAPVARGAAQHSEAWSCAGNGPCNSIDAIRPPVRQETIPAPRLHRKNMSRKAWF